jgi:hypothetical protein
VEKLEKGSDASEHNAMNVKEGPCG